MNDDDLSRLLGSLGQGAGPPLPDDARRARILDAMQQAARPARPGRSLRLLSLAVALAAVIGGAFALRPSPSVPAPVAAASGGVRLVQGEAILSRSGVVAPIAAAELPLLPGDRLGTLADGRATARLGGVAFASLSPMTELAVEPEGCELRAGSASFEVDPLPPGRRFLVRTHDVEIEVHGTAFRVSTGAGAPTRVVVSEGIVSVTPRHGGPPARLLAGSHWPPSAEPPALSAPPSASPAAAPSPPAPTAPERPRPASPPPEPRSDLAEQNRLMLEAADARRRGDTSAERHALETYLRRFPSGPFAAEARSLLARRPP